MATAPVTAEEAWLLFRSRCDGPLGHRARKVAEQSWVEDRELFDFTIDVMQARWARVWRSPVPDRSHPPEFHPELNYAVKVMQHRFIKLASARSARLATKPLDEQTASCLDPGTGSRKESEDPELALIRKERDNMIYTLVRRLPELHNRVVVMRTGFDMGVDEIAQALAMDKKAVSALHYRAMNKLRELARREGLL